jgi:hypothetical protein
MEALPFPFLAEGPKKLWNARRARGHLGGRGHSCARLESSRQLFHSFRKLERIFARHLSNPAAIHEFRGHVDVESLPGKFLCPPDQLLAARGSIAPCLLAPPP